MADNKIIMVLGAGTYQMPAILTAKEMGLQVLATDANPKAPGLKFADIARVVDLRDVEGSIAVAKEFDVSGVVSICTEVSVETVALITNELGLPGISPDAAVAATDKYIMRQKFTEAGLPAPPFRQACTVEEAKVAATEVGYPIVIKPVDSAGSRGVRKVDDESGMDYAFALAKSQSRKGRAIIEGFMEGVETTIESLTFRGETEVLAMSDKVRIPFPECVSVCLTYPPYYPAEVQEEIKRMVKRAIQAVGIDKGPTHTEVMVTPEGPRLVEMAARGGGYRIFSDIIPLVSGVNIVKETIKIALGIEPDMRPKWSRSAVLRFFDPQTHGKLLRIEGVEEAKAVDGIVDVVMEVEVGQQIGRITRDGERPGYLISTGETRQLAVQRADAAESQVRFVIGPDSDAEHS